MDGEAPKLSVQLTAHGERLEVHDEGILPDDRNALPSREAALAQYT